jgi:TolB protein
MKFAPGIISNTGTSEYSITIYPDGSEIYFSRYTPNQSNTTWETKFESPGWTPPAVAPFAMQYYNVPAFCAPDGLRMIFVSDRPLPGGSYDGIFRFWQVDRLISGWTDPEPVPGNFNDSLKMGPSLAANGNLYFSQRDQGQAFHFYRSFYSGGSYQTPELLPGAFNSFPSVGHIYIAPDESYAIFDALPEYPGNWKSYLYITERNPNGTWTDATMLPPAINATQNEYLGYVSPDQNYLFFARQDDLYWVNASEILPRKQYQGTIAYCYQPLTGGSLHQIWSIEADGTGNHKMIDATIGLNHHSWSPDGSMLAAVGYFPGVNETWSIHTFNADGTGLTRLTTTTGVWDTEPAWSPDGEIITWTRIYPDQGMRNDIWMMDATGGNQHFLGLEGFAPKYSPDGTHLVFAINTSGNWELYACQTDGSNIEQLTFTPQDEWFPSWSPDGKRIIYCRSEGSVSSTYEICKMNADGSDQVTLTCNNWMDCYPRYSPEGSSISFTSDASADDKWEVYVMDTSGHNIRRVTYSPNQVTAINADWKPTLNPGIFGWQWSKSGGIQMTVNPNPAKEVATVTCIIHRPGEFALYITDASGKTRKLRDENFRFTGIHTIQVSLSGLASGHYLISLTGRSGEQAASYILKN